MSGAGCAIQRVPPPPRCTIDRSGVDGGRGVAKNASARFSPNGGDVRRRRRRRPRFLLLPALHARHRRRRRRSYRTIAADAVCRALHTPESSRRVRSCLVCPSRLVAAGGVSREPCGKWDPIGPVFNFFSLLFFFFFYIFPLSVVVFISSPSPRRRFYFYRPSSRTLVGRLRSPFPVHAARACRVRRPSRRERRKTRRKIAERPPEWRRHEGESVVKIYRLNAFLHASVTYTASFLLVFFFFFILTFSVFPKPRTTTSVFVCNRIVDGMRL